jgi:hypothetical protein
MLHNEDPHSHHSFPDIIRMVRVGCATHTRKKNACRVLAEKLVGKIPVGKT